MTYKLCVDLILNWLKQMTNNLSFLLVIFFLAFPISILINFQLIETSYLDANFAGLSKDSPIRNSVLVEEGKSQPLPYYISQEIESKWPVKSVYERSISFEVRNESSKESKLISFISGGFKSLDIKPLQGSLESMEFPKLGQELVAAISYIEWKKHLKTTKNVIGKKIQINNKTVTIVAIMPETFISFREHQATSFVMPYKQLPELLDDVDYSITPDTYSYLIGNNQVFDSLTQDITLYLQNEALLLEESNILINRAIGINNQKYLTVSKRIYLLKTLFWLLLLFCFIAFNNFYSGECAAKQQEYRIRAFCGASNVNLLVQRFLDMFLTVLLIIIFCLFCLPLGHYFVQLFLPQVSMEEVSWNFSQLLNIIFYLFFCVLFFMSIVFLIQEKLIKTTFGRGQSASFSQKVQSYTLLALLLSLTIIALYSSLLLLENQRSIFKTHLGFVDENRFVVTFDFSEIRSEVLQANDTAQLLLQQLVSNPEIKQAAITSMPPLSEKTSYSKWFSTTGESIGTGAHGNTTVDTISADYFTTLGTKILLGNSVDSLKPMNIVVNQALWDRYLTDQTLADAQLLNVNTINGEKIAYRVIGVIENIYISGPDTQIEPTIYSPVLALTGFEGLVIESQISALKLTTIVAKIIKTLDVSFNGIKIVSLSDLIEKEHQPRLAILKVTLTATVLMFIAAIVFCFSTIKQLTDKNARELALRYCEGAKLGSLIAREYLFFIIVFIPIIMGCLTLFALQSDLLQKFLVGTSLLNITAITLIGVCVLLLVAISLGYHIKQKLRFAWLSLS